MPRIFMERSGEMEVFARVVEKGGFSTAARSLDLTPSAVSKLISRLEARLGTRLFVRTTRALTLTEEGEAYHQAALRVVQELCAHRSARKVEELLAARFPRLDVRDLVRRLTRFAIPEGVPTEAPQREPPRGSPVPLQQAFVESRSREPEAALGTAEAAKTPK